MLIPKTIRWSQRILHHLGVGKHSPTDEVKPGKCFRLFTKWSYEHELDDDNVPWCRKCCNLLMVGRWLGAGCGCCCRRCRCDCGCGCGCSGWVQSQHGRIILVSSVTYYLYDQHFIFPKRPKRKTPPFNWRLQRFNDPIWDMSCLLGRKINPSVFRMSDA